VKKDFEDNTKRNVSVYVNPDNQDYLKRLQKNKASDKLVAPLCYIPQTYKKSWL